MRPLLDKWQLAAELDPSAERIKAETVMLWAWRKKIPYLRMGYRTILFDPGAVWAALKKFEIQPRG